MWGLSAVAVASVASAWRVVISSLASTPATHFWSSRREAEASSLIESSRLRAISGTRTLSSNWPWLPARVIAASLPTTWAATWITTSGITGLTLPGMIEEPFCNSGRRNSARPARGPEPVSELLRLGLQRGLERAHRRQQVVRDLAERRQVDGGGEDVVRGLAHVDVVVGMGPLASEVCEHLVGVHVGGGAGAGLEDVDRELIVMFAGGDRVARGGDPLGQRRLELAELAADQRRCGLQPA